MQPAVAVTFLPSGATAWSRPGSTVLEAARTAGITLVAPCGGRGVCGSCAVSVVEGELEHPDDVELRGLVRAPADVRLACRARIAGPVSVRPLAHVAAPRPAATVGGTDLVVGIDLGTTNVAALAVEAAGGRAVATANVPNRQSSWGSDVLSRVAASLEGASGELRDAAIESIVDAVAATCADPARIGRIAIAGNTVMAGLLSGADLHGIAVAPYTAPRIPGTLDLQNTQLSCADALLVPPVASFVGGDVLAGAIHTGLLYAEHPAMLVDIGTNAEVMLASAGRLWAASAPAGPAFEGGGVECGGPAVDGAVVDVRVGPDGSVQLSTIGDAQPAWLSGAALLKTLAMLRRTGHLCADGLFQTEGPLQERFQRGEDGVLRVHLADDSGGGCLSLGQIDVRTVQLAKAAVRVGIEMVLADAGLRSNDLADLHVAGAFGGAVPVEDLVDLGVVPVGAKDVVRYAGNAALGGATAVALDPRVLDDAGERIANVRHVELAAVPGFPQALMRAVELAPYDV